MCKEANFQFTCDVVFFFNMFKSVEIWSSHVKKQISHDFMNLFFVSTGGIFNPHRKMYEKVQFMYDINSFSHDQYKFTCENSNRYVTKHESIHMCNI